jgi:hypothetical protein
MIKQFFIWLQYDEGWKSIMAIVYAIICLFDFIIVPILWNFNRQEALLMANAIAHDPGLNGEIAVEMLKSLFRVHTPYTLQGNGMFHLAFGALLTGSAISKFKDKL